MHVITYHGVHVCDGLQGCIELLRRSGVQMSGKTAAVVGRSNIVGLPVALLLQNEDATVTMVHSRTPNAGEDLPQALAYMRPGLAVLTYTGSRVL